MGRKLFVLTALILALLTGCSSAAPLALVSPAYPAAAQFDDYETQLAMREENALTKEFTDSLADFAFVSGAALFSDTQGNVNYSPASLYLALALMTAGAQGDTETQLLNALQAQNMTPDTLAEQCGRLYRLLYSDNEIGRVKLSASLWLNQGEKLKKDFKTTAGENFYAEVYLANLQDDKTHKVMGEWIGSRTSGKLAPEISVAEDTLMTLFTCLDFEDQWIDEFRKENNKRDDFTRADGSVITAEYLCRTYNPYSYRRGDGFTSTSLSMKNGSHMIFVLPDEDVSAAELAGDPQRLEEALTGGAEGSAKVILEIPKFDFFSSFDLKNTVSALGAGSIFGAEADLSGITGNPLFLSGIQQQSHISVDEKGVSAAAFTEIQYAGEAMMQEKVVEMVLNRPFVYAVMGNNGAILFMGICELPTEA